MADGIPPESHITPIDRNAVVSTISSPLASGVELRLSPAELAMAGATAGAVAKTVIAPADRVKILFQTDSARVFSMRNALSLAIEMYKADGVLSLWRGHGATLLRIVPYAGINFMCFDVYREFIYKLSVQKKAGVGKTDSSLQFLSGSLAGLTASFLTYPTEVVRARMATSSEGGYLRMVVKMRAEGLRAFYAGLQPTLTGVVPYAGLSFMTFEKLKGLRKDQGLSNAERFSAGALAGVVAQSATYPLDVTRRRMQVGRGEGGIWKTLRGIYGVEGLQGCFKGLSMNWVKGPIAMAVSFSLNDILKDHLRGRKTSTAD